MGDVASWSIRELKAELERRKIDTTGYSEKSELVQLVQAAVAASGSSDPRGESAPADAEPDLDLDAMLAQLSNLLDTLPASLQLLDRKWSETRQEKVRGQLRSVKQLLDQTAAGGAQEAGWQARLEEYNGLAKDFKRIRDLPRNMNG